VALAPDSSESGGTTPITRYTSASTPLLNNVRSGVETVLASSASKEARNARQRAANQDIIVGLGRAGPYQPTLAWQNRAEIGLEP
jgi:hypothetical protein